MRYKFEYKDEVCDYLVSFDGETIDDVFRHFINFLKCAGFHEKTIDGHIEDLYHELEIDRYLEDDNS